MGGGLMQLVAYGAQDIYLTGNPQITFFKIVYRRHTNFSMESIRQTFNGNITGGARVSSTIARNGDLIGRMYIETVDGKCIGQNTGNVSAVWIEEAEIEIGGQRIDKHYGSWMNTWGDLSELNPTDSYQFDGGSPSSKGTLFQKMSGMSGYLPPIDSGQIQSETLFIPLMFWFCRNPGLALPLIALQYHEVKLIVKFGDISIWDANGIPKTNLWVDYIFLDTDERRRFAQVSHEYLIEQVQADLNKKVEKNMDLNFNHPIKEIVWTVPFLRKPIEFSGTNISGFYLEFISFQINNSTIHEDSEWNLKLNGHERFKPRNRNYFTRTQIWQHHTGNASAINNLSSATDAIAVYSFALKPEEHQPSGTCNFSRIDNAQLCQTGETDLTNIDIYAVNYNVLRIMSGMGGLAYSN